jgi:hypothetical protein
MAGRYQLGCGTKVVDGSWEGILEALQDGWIVKEERLEGSGVLVGREVLATEGLEEGEAEGSGESVGKGRGRDLDGPVVGLPLVGAGVGP